MEITMEKAYLILATGQIFEVKSFGASGTGVGELVFTTGTVSYTHLKQDSTSNFVRATSVAPCIITP